MPSGGIWGVLLVTLVLSSSLPRTASAGGASCAADCDGDSVVRGNEVAACVGIALVLPPVAACDVCDTSPDVGVTVEDLVLAVSDSLGSCGPGPLDTGETGGSSSPGSDDALQDSIGIFDIGFIFAGDGDGGGAGGDGWRPFPAAAVMALHTPADGGAARFQACPLGGFADIVCTRGQPTHLEALYNQCAIPDGAGNTMIFNGDQVVDSPDPELCSGKIGFGTRVTSESFDLDLIVSADASPSYRRQRLRQMSLEVVVNGPGCTLTAGELKATGSTDTECFGRVANSRTDCGDELRLRRFVYDRLELQVATVDPEPDCTDLLTATGGLSVLSDSDGPPGVPFAVVFDDFRETLRQTPNGSILQQQGVQFVPCLGRSLLLETRLPITTPRGASCPVSGVLEVTEQRSGEKVFVLYTGMGGVGIDIDGDGVPEEVFESCLDMGLGQCFAAFPPPTPTPGGPSGLLCSPCGPTFSCDRRLECLPCREQCDSLAPSRCAANDTQLLCDDGIYGPAF